MTREELFNKLSEIEDKFYYKRSQWLIDFFDTDIEDYRITICDGEQNEAVELNALGAISYTASCVREIMKTDIEDYLILEVVINAINERIKTIESTGMTVTGLRHKYRI
jgi:hypothetical protein